MYPGKKVHNNNFILHLSFHYSLRRIIFKTAPSFFPFPRERDRERERKREREREIEKESAREKFSTYILSDADGVRVVGEELRVARGDVVEGVQATARVPTQPTHFNSSFTHS